MKLIKSFLFFALIFSVFVVNPGSIFASAKTDYDYQWAQYRQNYAEFSLLKTDYLQNPTLDNQQKAILSGKQSILARDKAKAAYARYLVDLIASKNTGYKELDPIITRLNDAAVYFTTKSQLSQQIITPSDMKTFATDYLNTYTIHDRSFYYGQVAAKIATLVRFQIDAKDGLDALIPKLPNVKPAQLQSRLDGIPALAANINNEIASITATIIPENEEGLPNQDSYFGKISDKLENVKKLQQTLIDQFIDIDISYVQPKI